MANSIVLSVATNANLPNLNALVVASVTATVPGQAQAIPATVPGTSKPIVAGMGR